MAVVRQRGGWGQLSRVTSRRGILRKRGRQWPHTQVGKPDRSMNRPQTAMAWVGGIVCILASLWIMFWTILGTWMACALSGSWVPLLGGIVLVAGALMLLSVGVWLFNRPGP